MIASQQSHVCWISGLQQHEQGKGFQAVVASIDKVPHENIVGAWDFSPCLKQLEQIMELTMDVSTNLKEELVLCVQFSVAELMPVVSQPSFVEPKQSLTVTGLFTG